MPIIAGFCPISIGAPISTIATSVAKPFDSVDSFKFNLCQRDAIRRRRIANCRIQLIAEQTCITTKPTPRSTGKPKGDYIIDVTEAYSLDAKWMPTPRFYSGTLLFEEPGGTEHKRYGRALELYREFYTRTGATLRSRA